MKQTRISNWNVQNTAYISKLRLAFGYVVALTTHEVAAAPGFISSWADSILAQPENTNDVNSETACIALIEFEAQFSLPATLKASKAERNYIQNMRVGIASLLNTHDKEYKDLSDTTRVWIKRVAATADKSVKLIELLSAVIEAEVGFGIVPPDTGVSVKPHESGRDPEFADDAPKAEEYAGAMPYVVNKRYVKLLRTALAGGLATFAVNIGDYSPLGRLWAINILREHIAKEGADAELQQSLRAVMEFEKENPMLKASEAERDYIQNMRQGVAAFGIAAQVVLHEPTIEFRDWAEPLLHADLDNTPNLVLNRVFKLEQSLQSIA